MVSVPAHRGQEAFATARRAAGVHAGQGGAIGVEEPIDDGSEGCASSGTHGRPFGAVSALWLEHFPI